MSLSCEVLTKSGPIRGKILKIDDDRNGIGFLGIPYAQPPVGELRFQKPQPVEPWKEQKICTEFGPRSIQADSALSCESEKEQSEAHCLTLNVIAPQWKEKEPYAVMFWIHGGGWEVSSSYSYGDVDIAKNLCTKNVIVVTINYRLGPLGFFTTGDQTCPGNMGLFDMVLALKWVKENISIFGGNPENITVFGQSAGGASTDILSLSPYSRDLFQKAIPMAGTSFNSWAVRNQAEQAAISKDYAKGLGWNGEGDSVELMKFMNSLPAEKLAIGIEISNFPPPRGECLLFSPVFDGDFFPKSIDQLRIEMPKKQLMTGVTHWEGCFLAAVFQGPLTMKGVEEEMEFALKKEKFSENWDSVKKAIIDFYSKGVTDDIVDQAKAAIKYHGDHLMNIPAQQYVKRMSELGNTVYFYDFDHFNPETFGAMRGILPFEDSSHCTELPYLFGRGMIGPFSITKPEDKKVSEDFITFFTNFAKFGNPNGETGTLWVPATVEQPTHYLHITENSRMDDKFQDNRAKFWEERVFPFIA